MPLPEGAALSLDERWPRRLSAAVKEHWVGLVRDRKNAMLFASNSLRGRSASRRPVRAAAVSLLAVITGSFLPWASVSRAFATESVPCPTTSFAAGSSHAIAVLPDGTAVAWGSNAQGQIGDGTTSVSRPLPTAVSGLSKVVAVAAGSGHSLAIDAQGSLWSWGWNAWGQLGNGSTTDSATPAVVPGLSHVTTVAAGNAHNLAIEADGSVWAWGFNQYGQLGDGTTNPSAIPEHVTGLPPVVAVAAGQGHSVAVGDDGSVWTWGANVHGQLGIGTNVGAGRPVQVPGLTGVVRVAAGDFHTFALLDDGSLRGWGDNGNGEIGIGSTGDRWSPVTVPIPEPVVSVSAGSDFSTAVTTLGRTYSWGLNSLGSLGTGPNVLGDQPSPTLVPGLQAMAVVSSKYLHSAALRFDGRLFTWGSDGDGESGTGTSGGYYDTPVTAHLPPLAMPCGSIKSTRRPPPLLLAHGMNGDYHDLEGAETMVKTLVPDLPGTYLSQSAAQGGIWQNAVTLTQEARNLTATTGEPRVDVLAHSKGGLDARAAMWDHPELFRSLGMLATPNGGSTLADALCVGQRLPVVGPVVQGALGFGPCQSSLDGLFDLQSRYIEDVFNKEVRDHPGHSFSVAAGNCNVAGALPVVDDLRCFPTAPPFCDASGGDGSVCVSSAFDRSTANGGLHLALDPVFDGLNHTDMRTRSCPISRGLAAIYGGWNLGNPWIDGNGPGQCDTIGGAASPARAPSASSSTAATSTSTTTPSVLSKTLVPQRYLRANADAAHPFTITLDAEAISSNARVEVQVPTGATASVAPRSAAGLDSTASVDTVPTTFGTVIEIDPDASTSTLTISVDVPAELVIEVRVEPGATTLTGAVSPGSAGMPSTIQATLANALPGTGIYSATARYSNGTDVVEVPLVDTNPLAATRTFAAQAAIPAGEFAPVDIVVTGPQTRSTSVSTVIPDSTATAGPISDQGPQDTNADGIADAIDVVVPITTTAADTYHLAVDARIAGQLVSSVVSTASLSVGTTSVHVQIPIADVIARGASGPLELRDARLSRGSDERRLAAVIEHLGDTNTYNPDTLAVTDAVLGYPTASNHDDATWTPAAAVPAETLNPLLAMIPVTVNGGPVTAPSKIDSMRLNIPDGRFDRLHVDIAAAVADPGPYRLRGLLIAPSGSAVAHVDELLTLPANRNTIGLDIDGRVVELGGSGRYTLTDISLASAPDPAREVFGRPLVMDLQSCGSGAVNAAVGSAVGKVTAPYCYGGAFSVP
jgi:alpha-tubulin suppressor-like RCC1 family protein